jgi:hypothetical protein
MSALAVITNRHGPILVAAPHGCREPVCGKLSLHAAASRGEQFVFIEVTSHLAVKR